MHRALVLLFLSTFGAVLPLGRADAATQAALPLNTSVHFDPSKCSTDPQGMVYFALGRRVFRQPMDNLSPRIPMNPETMARLPKPPKPDDPEGCPDHPLQGIGFYFYRLSLIPDPKKPAEAPNPIADSIGGELINMSFMATQQGNEEVYDKICKEGGASGEVAPGFNGCWYAHAVDPENRGRHGMFVQAKKTAYQDPQGGKFTLDCNVDWRNQRNDVYVCRNDYTVYRGLHGESDVNYGVSVDYSFNTANIPFNNIIALDQEVRRRIIAAEVVDYAWPDSNPSKGEGK